MKLAGIAGKVAAAISLRPWLLGAAAAAMAGALAFSAYAGMRYERAGWQTRQLTAMELARAAERAGVTIMHDSELAALAADRARLAESDKTMKELNDELEKRPVKCRVSRRAVRLLDGAGVPRDPGARAPAQRKAAAVETPAPDAGRQTPDASAGDSVECGTVVQNCAWNRVNTCDAAADQAEQLQEAYERLRRRYSRH